LPPIELAADSESELLLLELAIWIDRISEQQCEHSESQTWWELSSLS